MKTHSFYLRLVKRLSLATMSLFSLAITAPMAYAEEPKPPQKPLTIESKVTGSQEQPKVLYIMPWQGIANPIIIQDKETPLTMPDFQPINPTVFKQEVRDFDINQKSQTNVEPASK